jgi:FKBP-type peptidyl-prolyl cis-trans isomerase FkpA
MRLRSISLLSLLVLAGACALADSTQPSVPADEEYAASLGVDIATMTKYSADLYYKDLVVGTGTAAAVNKTITVVYSGYLRDGTKFDGDSVSFVLNNGLIPGWVLGLPGMKVGGTRKLVVGSSYAYGAQGNSAPGHPDIPPHATLVFDIKLTDVK